MDKRKIIAKGLKAINYLIYIIPTIIIITYLCFQDEALFPVTAEVNVESSPLSFKSLKVITDFLGVATCNTFLYHIISSALWMIVFDMIYTQLQKADLIKCFKFGLL